MAAHQAFLEENPAARALFEQIDIPLVDVSEMTLRVSEGENSQEDAKAMAQAWIADNRDAVDAWLEVAREHADP